MLKENKNQGAMHAIILSIINYSNISIKIEISMGVK